MRYLLIYDIAHDGARAKVADTCLDYGLERIQYSAYVGNLTHVHQRELLVKIRRRLGKQRANIQLFPLNELCWSQRHIIAQEGEE
jgi:CRISPR-associated protein Cas2